MSAPEFDDWLNGLGTPMDVDAMREADLALCRSLYEAYGPVDSSTVRVAFRLRQAELAAWAVSLVTEDIRRTTDLSPSIEIVEFNGGDVMPSYNGSYGGSSVMSVDPASVLVEVADQLQGGVVDDLWQGWPRCGEHDSGAFAELRDGQAVWWCRKEAHRVAEIGSLEIEPA